MAQDNGTVFGIDLGTTYSCISYIDETGNPVVATNLDGERTTPSVVAFTDDGDVVVGQIAKEEAVLAPDRTVQFVKTLMGKSTVAKTIDGKDKSPEEISSYILRKLTNDASETCGLEAKNVVITVPAYFGSDERKATENAGKIAGLNVLSLVQEPVAAAVYYGCTKCETDQTLLVYDLGGGTFDVTVISVTNAGQNIDVICSDGNHELGGRNWDQVLIEYLQDLYRDEADFDGEYDGLAVQTFQSLAEQAKKQLTQKSEARVTPNICGIPKRLTVSREKFEQLSAHLLEETLTVTNKMMEKAKEKGFDINKILLVGGSTFMPQVKEALQKVYPDIPQEINEPNEAVAKGAALIALSDAIKVNSQQSEASGESDKTEQPVIALPGSVATEEITLPNISLATTKSYGVKTYIDEDLKISNLILKNQKMHDNQMSHTERFGTHKEGQSGVDVSIYESDEDSSSVEIGGRKPIAKTKLEFEKPMPKGSKVDVTFTLDSNGILSVKAVDVASGKECNVRVETSGLSEEEVEKITSTALQLNVE